MHRRVHGHAIPPPYMEGPHSLPNRSLAIHLRIYTQSSPLAIWADNCAEWCKTVHDPTPLDPLPHAAATLRSPGDSLIAFTPYQVKRTHAATLCRWKCPSSAEHQVTNRSHPTPNSSDAKNDRNEPTPPKKSQAHAFRRGNSPPACVFAEPARQSPQTPTPPGSPVPAPLRSAPPQTPP